MTKFLFKCIHCGKEYPEYPFQYLCPVCNDEKNQNLPPKGILKVIYNYKTIKNGKDEMKLSLHLQNAKYLDLLPIRELTSLPKLKIGHTPIYEFSSNFGWKKDLIFFKDDSQNPTYSFKDRASSLVSAYAKENGINTIVAASTGNAGSSIAGICASQQQNAIVFVPAKAPLAKLTQIIMYGAQLVPINGTYDQAFDLSIKVTEEYGFFNRNTAFNPFTIEGKKTAAFEIFEQFIRKLPEKIFVPVGDGVIISGLYKGFEELLLLGLIEKIPEIIAVQASGSNAMAENYQKSTFKSHQSNTIADSISVDIPRNFYMACQYIEKYQGSFVQVSDNEILDASVLLSNRTGLFAEPASASAFAGLIKLKKDALLNENEKHLVLLTGSGLKDLGSVQGIITMPKKINPDINEVKKILEL